MTYHLFSSPQSCLKFQLRSLEPASVRVFDAALLQLDAGDSEDFHLHRRGRRHRHVAGCTTSRQTSAKRGEARVAEISR